MPSMYQPTIPTGNLDLDVDYKNIQDNFSQLNTTYAVDHVALTDGTAQNGYHKAMHMVQQVAPAAVSGVGSLYCTTVTDGLDTDQILYYKTGLNKIIQMTRNFVPLAATNGYTFIPGGLMVQWGRIGSPVSGDNTVLFATSNKDFPSNCFNVFLSLERSNANTSMIVIKTGSISKTGFKAILPTSGSTAFFWLAIGN